MFGLGIWEIIIIILAVVVLINPREFPNIARKLGRWYRKIRDVQYKVDKEVQDLENDFRRKESGEEEDHDRSY